MNLVSKSPQRPKRWLNALIFALIGAPVGYFFGGYLARLEKSGALNAEHFAWSELVALLLAALMLMVGVIIMIMSVNRKLLGRQINPEEQRPATPAQVVFYAQNGGVLILAGLLMATPVVVSTSVTPSPALASAVMVGLIAVWLLQTALNLSIWMRSDELLRQALGETAAICFVVLEGALFLWAAGEKLGLLPTLSLWDALTVTMAVYLLVSGLVSWRRGLT